MKYLKTYELFEFNNRFLYNDIIDYTFLVEHATDADIIELCRKADEYGVKSVCVLPIHVKLAAQELSKSEVLVCTVVSFPDGTNSPNEKLSETRSVIADGADEVDMVMNYKLLKELFAKNVDINTIEGEDQWNKTINKLTFEDIEPLVEECHSNMNKDGEPIILKVIVESGLLTDYETEEATHICMEAGADYIKTSTGKVPVGAESDKIKIMRDIIKEYDSDMKIKVSGGIRKLEQIEMMKSMVDRFGIGCDTVDILNGQKTDKTNLY